MLKRIMFYNFLRMFSLICLPVFCVGGLIFLFSTRTLTKDTQSKTENAFMLMEKNLNTVFNEVRKQRDIFENNPTLYLSLMKVLNNDIITYDEMQVIQTITPIFNSTLGYDNTYNSMYVYISNKKYSFYSSNRRLEQLTTSVDSDWYNDFISTPVSTEVWFRRRSIQESPFYRPTEVVSVFQRFKSNSIIVININSSYLENLLDSITADEDQLFYILDQENKPFALNTAAKKLNIGNIDLAQKEIPTTIILGREKYFIKFISSANGYTKYLFLIPHSSIYALSNNIITATILVGSIGLLISLSLAYKNTIRRHEQVLSILSVFEAAEKQMPLPAISSNTTDEYSLILNNIIKIFVENSYLSLQLSESKYKQLTAELTALQCQLNPHFLFNTLQNIQLEIISRQGNSSAAVMLSNLSHLLKYSLSNPNSKVTVAEEIEAAKTYISIQRLRYENKFDVLWDYEENILHHSCLKLLLQPLIENSLYHGIREKPGKSMIKIKISIKGSQIHYVVIDNGIGISKSRIIEIRNRLKENTDFAYTHIGLFNTNKRIQLHDKDNLGIIIRSKQNFGTVISFYFPLSTEN